MEKCQRCGEEGEDRRTLWMACFYRMGELKLPFGEVSIKGMMCQKIGEKESAFGGMVPVFAEPDADSNHHRFYTLRVCKSCRADWMNAIAMWFRDRPEPEESCGSGIYIRDLGKIREITIEEWNARKGQ